jgi:hypothetical protein
MQLNTVNSKSQTSNYHCSLFSKKNPIIRIFSLSGWLTIPINPGKQSSTALLLLKTTLYTYSIHADTISYIFLLVSAATHHHQEEYTSTYLQHNKI